MKILLAIDQSNYSAAAAQAVIQQFPPQGHTIHVLHAVDWERSLHPSLLYAQGPNAARDVLEERDTLCGRGEALVADTAATLRAAGFTVTTSAVPEGDARTAILDAAANSRADLIVVGSHGRTGLNRLLLGSVAEYVVRHAACSVQVVRQPAS